MHLGRLLKSVSKDYQKIHVREISFDSRKVKKGDIFFAIKGSQTSGIKFINDAISKEASVIISSKKVKYLHSQEGLDDMPAHIRTMLTSNNLSFSVVDSKLEIGIWQGIYIWEHRTSNKSRSLQLHAIGDFDLN